MRSNINEKTKSAALNPQEQRMKQIKEKLESREKRRKSKECREHQVTASQIVTKARKAYADQVDVSLDEEHENQNIDEQWQESHDIPKRMNIDPNNRAKKAETSKKLMKKIDRMQEYLNDMKGILIGIDKNKIGKGENINKTEKSLNATCCHAIELSKWQEIDVRRLLDNLRYETSQVKLLMEETDNSDKKLTEAESIVHIRVLHACVVVLHFVLYFVSVLRDFLLKLLFRSIKKSK